jgi:hypothetical protein
MAGSLIPIEVGVLRDLVTPLLKLERNLTNYTSRNTFRSWSIASLLMSVVSMT